MKSTIVYKGRNSMNMGKIDNDIVTVLKKEDKPITAYRISKMTEPCYNTINEHLWKIYVFKRKFKIKLKKEEKIVNYRKRTYWSIRGD